MPEEPSSSVEPVRRSRYLYVVACMSALGGLLFGYDTGVISGALLFIREDFAVTPFMQGVIVSSLLVGAMVGALGCGPLADRIGRRRVILLAAAVFAVGALVSALTPSVLVLVAARVILGLGVGAASVIVPLYIAEMAPPDIRGRLVTLNQLMITVGIVVAYGVNAATAPFEAWRWALGLAIIPSAIFGTGFLFLPESPRWLVVRGDTSRARDVLARVRAHDQVEGEIEEIRDAQGRAETRWKDLLAPAVLPLVVVALVLNFLGQASGINTIIYFAPTILERTSFGDSAAILATVGIGLVNVAMTLVGMALVDKVGRKPLLLGGLIGMTVSLAVLGLVFLLPELSGTAAWFALVSLIVYIASFAVSVGVIIFLIPAEILPLNVRGKAMSIALVINWGSNFVIALTFLPLLNALGGPTTFWMYGGICIVFVFFARFFIPETKGRSLEDIETQLRRRASSKGRRSEVAGTANHH